MFTTDYFSSQCHIVVVILTSLSNVFFQIRSEVLKLRIHHSSLLRRPSNLSRLRWVRSLKVAHHQFMICSVQGFFEVSTSTLLAQFFSLSMIFAFASILQLLLLLHSPTWTWAWWSCWPWRRRLSTSHGHPLRAYNSVPYLPNSGFPEASQQVIVLCSFLTQSFNSPPHLRFVFPCY